MKAYSEDLRERVIRAVEAGRPREEVAARFEVSVPTIERWVRLKRETGGLARRPVAGSGAGETAGLQTAVAGGLAGERGATPAGPRSLWRAAAGWGGGTAAMRR